MLQHAFVYQSSRREDPPCGHISYHQHSSTTSNGNTLDFLMQSIAHMFAQRLHARRYCFMAFSLVLFSHFVLLPFRPQVVLHPFTFDCADVPTGVTSVTMARCDLSRDTGDGRNLRCPEHPLGLEEVIIELHGPCSWGRCRYFTSGRFRVGAWKSFEERRWGIFLGRRTPTLAFLKAVAGVLACQDGVPSSLAF